MFERFMRVLNNLLFFFCIFLKFFYFIFFIFLIVYYNFIIILLDDNLKILNLDFPNIILHLIPILLININFNILIIVKG
jgi:hypothetical protein